MGDKMMKSTRRLIFLSICALLIGSAAVPGELNGAIITGISGEIEVKEIPASLDGGDFISQTHIRLMHEGVGIVTAGMPDFLYDGAYHDPGLPIAPGDNTFGNAVTTPYNGPGLPAVGTEVYSVLLHFDPNLSGLPFSLTEGIAQAGTIVFDRPILGVYVTSGALDATDDIFSPSGVIFPSAAGRDMEFNYDGDIYLISPDRYELSLTMFTHNGGVLDEMRIILSSASVNSCPGDIWPAEGDGSVNADDLAVFAGNFGNTDCSGDECRGDFDDPADNDIDAADLAVMIDEIGRTDCL